MGHLMIPAQASYDKWANFLFTVLSKEGSLNLCWIHTGRVDHSSLQISVVLRNEVGKTLKFWPKMVVFCPQEPSLRKKTPAHLMLAGFSKPRKLRFLMWRISFFSPLKHSTLHLFKGVLGVKKIRLKFQLHKESFGCKWSWSSKLPIKMPPPNKKNTVFVAFRC